MLKVYMVEFKKPVLIPFKSIPFKSIQSEFVYELIRKRNVLWKSTKLHFEKSD